jgi:hypothetical protein
MIEGVITSFDGERGGGIFRSARCEALYFHCVSLRDGTRSIEGECVRERQGPWAGSGATKSTMSRLCVLKKRGGSPKRSAVGLPRLSWA